MILEYSLFSVIFYSQKKMKNFIYSRRERGGWALTNSLVILLKG